MTDTLPRIQVKSLDHVTLVVRSLEASRRFYVDLLGMEEVPRPAFSFTGSWFQAGPTQIHLILDESATPTGSDSTRTHHFAFQVDDAAAAVARIEEAGVHLISPPKSRPDGATQVFIRDPDGHSVELCSLPKK